MCVFVFLLAIFGGRVSLAGAVGEAPTAGPTLRLCGQRQANHQLYQVHLYTSIEVYSRTSYIYIHIHILVVSVRVLITERITR